MSHTFIEGDPTVVRELHSKAILAVDKTRLNAHRQRVNQGTKLIRMEKQINTMMAQIVELQAQVKALNDNRN
jgi:hypothetical protein